MFGFPVEVKTHKSGDPNENKAPEAEVPEGTDGPQQLIGQFLQAEREKKRLHSHAHTVCGLMQVTRLQRGLSAQDKHLPGETGVKA